MYLRHEGEQNFAVLIFVYLFFPVSVAKIINITFKLSWGSFPTESSNSCGNALCLITVIHKREEHTLISVQKFILINTVEDFLNLLLFEFNIVNGY